MKNTWTIIVLQDADKPVVSFQVSRGFHCIIVFFLIGLSAAGYWEGYKFSEGDDYGGNWIVSEPSFQEVRALIADEIVGDFENYNTMEPQVFESEIAEEQIESIEEMETSSRSLLTIVSARNGERIQVSPLNSDGSINRDVSEKISDFFRCRRTNLQVSIHEKLIRLLYNISQQIDGHTLYLISGYRTPNLGGTAPTSRHTIGEAADIQVPGMSLQDLRMLAHELGAGGIGYYPDDGFLHIDVREQHFFWEQRHGINYRTIIKGRLPTAISQNPESVSI